jgi:hypothetical protein
MKEDKKGEGTYLKSIGGPIISLSTFLFLNPTSILLLSLSLSFPFRGVRGDA